jgi:hypothetical protein
MYYGVTIDGVSDNWIYWQFTRRNFKHPPPPKVGLCGSVARVSLLLWTQPFDLSGLGDLTGS